MNLVEVARQQERLAKQVIRYDDPAYHDTMVIGLDVAYSEEIGVGAAVVVNNRTKETIASTTIVREIKSEYIPGLFQLREGPFLIELVQGIRQNGIILVDGNGILHPRRYGLASYLGVTLNRQTIGVAKKLLLGKISHRTQKYADIIHENEVLGRAVLHDGRKPIYVSIGHKVSLNTAVQVVIDSCVKGYPEVLRRAHILSKR